VTGTLKRGRKTPLRKNITLFLEEEGREMVINP
jgi:hypothetical protein